MPIALLPMVHTRRTTAMILASMELEWLGLGTLTLIEML